jgi:hypothetical protein
MVTCQNCGFPFPSKILQLSSKEFHLRKFPHFIEETKRYSEECPKCKSAFDYYLDSFFWKDHE